MVLHTTCLMHKFWSCLTNSLSGLNFMIPLFCTTCFIRNAQDRSKLRALVKAELKSKLRVIFHEPPNRADCARANSMVLQLLQVAERYAEDQTEQSHGRRKQRRAAWVALMRFVPAVWMPGGAEIVHYCSVACGCRSEQDALDKLTTMLQQA